MAEKKTKAGSKTKSKRKPQRRALGRGLDALFPTAAPTSSAAASTPSQKQNKDSFEHYGPDAVFNCPIERITPRSDQPRRRFDPDALEELAQTIEEHGVIQPIVLRRIGRDRFEIIAGERRWRAVQKAGLKQIPCVVKDISPDNAFELALIENLQRQELDALEVAEAYERLSSEHGLSQQTIADRMGKSRVAVANTLRLLKLPLRVRQYISEGRLSEGHGRALLGATDPAIMSAIAERAVRGRYTVRKVEQLVRASRSKGGTPSDEAPSTAGKSPAIRDLEQRLIRRIGAKTTVEHKKKGGTLTVHYNDLDELDAILERLGC